MSIADKLFEIANTLSPYTNTDFPKIQKLIDAATDVGKSGSGSWFGYHSRVYYNGFSKVPPGARFSIEWGLQEVYDEGSIGEWVEYDFDEVVKVIKKKAGNSKIDDILKLGDEARNIFEQSKFDVQSLTHSNFDGISDNFLTSILKKIETHKIVNEKYFIQYAQPKGQFISRDAIAHEKGLQTPPHISVLAEALTAQAPFDSCLALKTDICKLASHIQNLENKKLKQERIGTNIFIGHGRSPIWRELKDFVNERLSLPCDEFNQIPVAGLTNITRLVQMMDKACFAFLIMTAEDELADGNKQARMNVIHEVGLFQGRLGFERAIVLLEEGCEEFSNIQGLGQIRFQKGNISAAFEEIRHVLEREEIL